MISMLDRTLDDEWLTQLLNPVDESFYRPSIPFTIYLDSAMNRQLLGGRIGDQAQRRIPGVLFMQLQSPDPVIQRHAIQDVWKLGQEIIEELSQPWRWLPRDDKHFVAAFSAAHDMLDYWGVAIPEPKHNHEPIWKRWR